MRKVTCSMGMSLDGYVVGPDGSFAWSAPDEEVFRSAMEEVRQLGVHLLGRRLYETMRCWETAGEDPALSDLEREFAALWIALPKVVLSTQLTSVDPGYELARGSLADEVDRWRSELGEGDIAVGGATLAHQAAELGLIDEYGLRVHPVLVGGGTPLFPRAEARADLELVSSRTFSAGVVGLRYRVKR
jgi:dihydrofolate reductase